MSNSKDGPADPGHTAGAPPDGAIQDSGDKEEALLRQRAIGKRLKPLWDDITKEPLPDDFMSLLNDMAPEDGDDKAGAP